MPPFAIASDVDHTLRTVWTTVKVFLDDRQEIANPLVSATMSTTEEVGRVSRRQVDKFEERRRELADAALQTLSELGYARTSLREIAQNSAFSHGVLHYYFRDKVELITYCVRQYKSVCAKRYDNIVATADNTEDLADGFLTALLTTLKQDATMHRLWYDLRSQALFEPSFREDVLEIDAMLERMIWRVLSRYAELANSPVQATSPAAYAMFDGLFQQALLRHLAGQEDAGPTLRTSVLSLVAALVPQ